MIKYNPVFWPIQQQVQKNPCNITIIFFYYTTSNQAGNKQNIAMAVYTSKNILHKKFTVNGYVVAITSSELAY